jgi:hypothetical protein
LRQVRVWLCSCRSHLRTEGQRITLCEVLLHQRLRAQAIARRDDQQPFAASKLDDHVLSVSPSSVLLHRAGGFAVPSATRAAPYRLLWIESSLSLTLHPLLSNGSIFLFTTVTIVCWPRKSRLTWGFIVRCSCSVSSQWGQNHRLFQVSLP